MLNVSENAAAGYEPVNPLRNDPVYVSAVELSNTHFPWHKFPSHGEITDPMKRVLAREIGELMRRVQTWTDAKVSATKSLTKAEAELATAREELAAAVAAWPKE